MRSVSLLASLVVSFAFAACTRAQNPSAASTGGCPDAVTQSIAKKFSKATMEKCKAEREDGHDQFEVTLDENGTKTEVDVAPDGTILQTESVVALESVPAKVMDAFSAKYGGKPTKAEKVNITGKGTFYELKLPADAKAKEVTFGEDGSFVEEE